MTLKHIIFDCDGVLVDSEPLSMRADVTLLQHHGAAITEDEAHRRFVGKTFAAMIDEIVTETGIAFPADLSERKDAMLEKMFRDELQAVSGIQDVLEGLAARGIRFSVASNSPRRRVLLALEIAGIASFMEEVTTFEDVLLAKPAPDVFLRALAKADVSPAQCCVVEDSATGVTSAVNAGLTTFGFTGTHHQPEKHAETLQSLGAKTVFQRMAELPLLV